VSEIELTRADVPLNCNSRHQNTSDHQDAATNFCGETDLRLTHSTSGVFNPGLMSPAESCLPPLLLSNQSEAPGKIDKPGNYSETLTVDGIPRHYHLHVPPNYDPSRPMPLALVLHGHGDDAAGVERYSGMDAEADKNGFIVAYPEAIQWFGAKNLAAWDTDNGLLPPGVHVDDRGFLRKVIDICQGQLSIDQNRTYLVGFSNGGMEAYKAATELSDKLAAVVAVSGAMCGAERKPRSPVSILSIVGTSDNVVPPAGRTMEEEAAAAAPDTMRMLSKVFPVLKDEQISPAASELLQRLAIETGYVPEFKPVTYATDFWRSADGITEPGTATHDGAITTETYTNPQNGVTVEQEIVAGGDHMVQHGTPPGFNLADEVWKFLEAHPQVKPSERKT
jgi:poly(3-hydroxybutyrate) depolymerase